MADHESNNLQIEDRKKYTDLILVSQSKNKIIVAGAGTGKSFTFKSLLILKGNNSLALTFINNLSLDLAKDLEGLADVYTFHGYCKRLLHKIAVEGIDKHFTYYPKLPKIIQSDATILADYLSHFEEAIQKLDEGEKVEFYLARSNYYNAVGHSDSVYRVLKYFVKNPGSIPKFAQIVVDEYQDFNPLEVEFIEQLAIPNPVLIAGDDDQAIYDFKNASPEFIRKRANTIDFERFELPYCSRCTHVVVSAVIDITEKAKELGLLQNRIQKKYICFMPEKEADSETYPKIIHASCSIQNKQYARNYIGKYIESEINKIPESEINLAVEKGYPCVLIIGPSQYLKQLSEYLKNIFPNVDYKERKENEIELIEGYRLLMLDENSNLGWRILLEFEDVEMRERVINASREKDSPLFNLLDEEYKSKNLEIVKIIKKVIDGEAINTDGVNLIKSTLKKTIEELKDIVTKPDDEEEASAITDRSLAIKLTTVNGSKGMSGGFVFILGMNNGDLPKYSNKPKDQEICQLIVALTRTRKQCYLISNKRFGIKYGIKESCFINWISTESILHVNVDVNYFKNLSN